MTEPRYMLDSNILIYILNGMDSALRRQLEEHEPGTLIVSAISYAEVMRGIARDDRELERDARRLFEVFPVVSFDRAAAEMYRQVPFRRGRFDSLIAAHALSLDLVVVTNNERDFADIPGLKVENWTHG